MKALFAELYGKDSGCSRGRGGSMHLIDMRHNILGTSAVVGTTIPVAMGWALALQHEGSGRIVASFFGDGATEEGCFYECLNFAALHKLPMLLVCENNGFAIHTPLSKRWATSRLCERVETYGIPAVQIADADVMGLYNQVQDASLRLRNGGGPESIECLTYRWKEHVGPNEDYEAGYRARSELVRHQLNDPLGQLGRQLSLSERVRIDAEIDARIEEAVVFAEASHFPPVEDLSKYVFA